MSTVGANINEVEKQICEKVGCKCAVALSAGTAALNLAIKLKVYGKPAPGVGALDRYLRDLLAMTFLANQMSELVINLKTWKY